MRQDRTLLTQKEPATKRNRRDLIKTTEAKHQQQRLEDVETNTTSPVHDPVSSEKVSSKGRIIRPPVWFKDYVTD